MKLVPIPTATLKACKQTDERMKKSGDNPPWWRVPFEKIGTHAILAVSTGGGPVRQGHTIYLIAGHDRTIFPDGCPVDGLSIHEYVGIVEHTGWQPLIQLGRDANIV